MSYNLSDYLESRMDKYLGLTYRACSPILKFQISTTLGAITPAMMESKEYVGQVEGFVSKYYAHMMRYNCPPSGNMI